MAPTNTTTMTSAGADKQHACHVQKEQLVVTIIAAIAFRLDCSTRLQFSDCKSAAAEGDLVATEVRGSPS